MSRLKRPGPRMMLRPAVPKVPGVVTCAKAAGLKYEQDRFPVAQAACGWPCINWIGPTMLGVCVLPGAFNACAPEPVSVTVNGVPLKALRIQLSCQPPASLLAHPVVAHFLPLPKGRSQSPQASKLFVRSKPARARFLSRSCGSGKRMKLISSLSS